MTRRFSTPALACPLCGKPLSIVPAETVQTIAPAFYVRGRALKERVVPTVIAACSACEFIHELTPREQALYRDAAGGLCIYCNARPVDPARDPYCGAECALDAETNR